MKAKLMFAAAAMLAVASCGPKAKVTTLFNGTDLTGWTAVTDTTGGVSGEGVFTVKDGCICVTGQPFGYLRTDAVYCDYKLHVEWRWVGEGTNSGIFQRVQDEDTVWPVGYECQLKAGNAGDVVCLGGSTVEGAEPLPGRFAVKKRNNPETAVEKADGEWNTAEIVCKGNTVTIYINGELKNECVGSLESGHIALQSEGGPVEFRNVYLTEE